MPGFAPYILLVIFFAAIVPLVRYGAQARDIEAEAAAHVARTHQRLHRLARIGEVALAGLTALGALLASVMLLRKRKGRAA